MLRRLRRSRRAKHRLGATGLVHCVEHPGVAMILAAQYSDRKRVPWEAVRRLHQEHPQVLERIQFPAAA